MASPIPPDKRGRSRIVLQRADAVVLNSRHHCLDNIERHQAPSARTDEFAEAVGDFQEPSLLHRRLGLARGRWRLDRQVWLIAPPKGARLHDAHAQFVRMRRRVGLLSGDRCRRDATMAFKIRETACRARM